MSQTNTKFGPILERAKRCLRSPRYFTNMTAQDLQGVRSRMTPMLGFKSFKRAAVRSAGFEFLRRIRKGQLDLGRLGAQGQAEPAIWIAMLSA